MKKKERIIAVMMAVAMVGGTAAPMVQASDEKDVVTALIPPVSSSYQEWIYDWAEEFEAENPDIEIEITTASWEDVDQKLDTLVNAGSPPDIAFVGMDDVATYVDLGMAIDLSQYLDEAEIEDFDESLLAYFQVEDGIYGLPLYGSPWCIGGNRQMLEDAGIDWQSVQQNGWTYDEFREAIANGVITDENGEVATYGFVFACSGVTATDYFNIFVNNAGMPSAFDEDLKYTYTSSMMLDFLEDIRALIDDGSMPSYLNSIDAGMRWNMFLTGQTMITGKGLSSFERSAANNNALIEAGEGEEVEGSIEVDYIVLPVPVFENGSQNVYATVDGFICFTGETNPDEEHLKNVASVAYYLASGERAATTFQEVYSSPACASAQAAFEEMDPIENKNEYNTAAVEMLMSQVTEARTDIPASLSSQATEILDEVIVPNFQALLGGEITAQEMYDAIVEAGYAAFGEDGCITD